MPRPEVSRRDFMRLAAAGVLGGSASGLLPALAARAAESPDKPRRSVVLLWLNGGPSTIDMWDLKPGHENGGPIKPRQTSAPGLQISEHMPSLAKQGERLALVRSLTTREGDHGRASYLMRTGFTPTGAVQYPTLGSSLSKELGDPRSQLPNFVAISPFRFFNFEAYGPGFLGPQYAPLIVGERGFDPGGMNADSALKVRNLSRPNSVAPEQALSRYDLLRDMQHGFAAGRPGGAVEGHDLAYDRAVRLMEGVGAKAFDLADEPTKLRDSYGRTVFGQGCLLARRLIERGVAFVEVTLDGWDTHGNNFDQVPRLTKQLDQGWGSLMDDLHARGMLETTTILCVGEFGRTPRINGAKGRDHFPNAWAAALAGGGIKGGQAYGKTSADGNAVEDKQCGVADLMATLCAAAGLNPAKTNDTNMGRPIRLVDKAGEPIKALLS